MKVIRRCCILLPIFSLSGCHSLNQLSEVGKPPSLSQINNPKANPQYAPVHMPMPRPHHTSAHVKNTLWRPGARGFFKDQRAQRVGDIVTLLIHMSDKASFDNKTTNKRTSSHDIHMGSLMGIERSLAKKRIGSALPRLADVSSDPSHEGDGKISRNEAMDVKVAATIHQILPNGNLVVAGRQEMRINYEVREILVTGIVRPQDISSQNTIDYEKIAEARISYGGRGHLTNSQQAPWGHQILDAISPL